MSKIELNVLEIAEIQVQCTPKIKPSERVQVTCSKDAEKVFRCIWNHPLELKECAYALFLNRANKVIGYLLISVGGISGTVIDQRNIFQTALKVNASSCIVGHPSNNTTPSEADLKITQKLKDSVKLIDIMLVDHLIILEEGYVSLADEGYL
jgi:DNA repair protein RadC